MPKSAAKLGAQVVYLFGDRAIQRAEFVTLAGLEAISNCEQEYGHRLSVFGTDFFVNLGIHRAAAQRQFGR